MSANGSNTYVTKSAVNGQKRIFLSLAATLKINERRKHELCSLE